MTDKPCPSPFLFSLAFLYLSMLSLSLIFIMFVCLSPVESRDPHVNSWLTYASVLYTIIRFVLPLFVISSVHRRCRSRFRSWWKSRLCWHRWRSWIVSPVQESAFVSCYDTVVVVFIFIRAYLSHFRACPFIMYSIIIVIVYRTVLQ
jgi:hypothetical protein